MAYDESEDPEELLKYDDFGDFDNNNSISSTDNFSNNELVLDNGLRVSHRRFLRTNKHHHRQQQQQQQSLDKEEEKEEDVLSLASLPRRERRQQQHHHNTLAITDGSTSQQQNTAQGIRETSAKQHFIQKLSTKNNLNTTLRARAQVPI